MKFYLLIFIFSFCFNFSWAGDTIVLFHNSQIKLPSGFKEFSKNQLTAFKSTIFNRQILTVYEKKAHPADLQRIIIYYDSLPRTKNLPFDKILEIKLEVLEEQDVVFNDINIDKKNHYAYGKIVMLGDTSIFGFSIDKNGIMGIQFDSSNGIRNSDEQMFSEIMKSIKHSSPFEYIPKENSKAKKAKKDMENSGMAMTIAFIVLLLIWLTRKYIIKNR